MPFYKKKVCTIKAKLLKAEINLIIILKGSIIATKITVIIHVSV